jgi:hypothetical protein
MNTEIIETKPTETQKTEGRVVTMPLAQIKPYWRNPRDNEASVPAVMKSIEDYGYNQFIVVDADHVIIAGHTRYKALMRLGWKKAKVIVADLPPEKAKEYRIIDNKSGERSKWNDGLLLQELRETDLVIMQQYFDEDLNDLIKASTGAVDWKDVTENDVVAALEDEENLIVEIDRSRKEATKDVICPYCGEEFQIL